MASSLVDYFCCNISGEWGVARLGLGKAFFYYRVFQSEFGGCSIDYGPALSCPIHPRMFLLLQPRNSLTSCSSLMTRHESLWTIRVRWTRTAITVWCRVGGEHVSGDVWGLQSGGKTGVHEYSECGEYVGWLMESATCLWQPIYPYQYSGRSSSLTFESLLLLAITVKSPGRLRRVLSVKQHEAQARWACGREATSQISLSIDKFDTSVDSQTSRLHD